jgi:hypothetical protein
MKSMYLRFCVAMACALGLAACGGNSGNLLLGGHVIGLTRDGLVVQNNGGTPFPVPANSIVYSFPDLIGNDQKYNVTIQSSPPSAVCTVVNGTGTSGAYSVTSVDITCITKPYDLGGTVSGLDASGLVLVNGSDRQEIPAGATSFTMTRKNADGSYASGKVGDGSPYGVTVLTQPAGRSCTVNNGVGTMGAAAVMSIQVNCI